MRTEQCCVKYYLKFRLQFLHSSQNNTFSPLLSKVNLRISTAGPGTARRLDSDPCYLFSKLMSSCSNATLCNIIPENEQCRFGNVRKCKSLSSPAFCGDRSFRKTQHQFLVHSLVFSLSVEIPNIAWPIPNVWLCATTWNENIDDLQPASSMNTLTPKNDIGMRLLSALYH